MRICKKFKFEMAHLVRWAYSKRCAKSLHWHSYKLELYFKSYNNSLNSAWMIIDFWRIKDLIFDFIDSFDHSVLLWDNEKKEVIEFFKSNFERVIVFNHNSSAEEQVRAFFWIIQWRLNSVLWWNILLDEAILWETESGSASFTLLDYKNDLKILPRFKFSSKILKDWKVKNKDILISKL